MTSATRRYQPSWARCCICEVEVHRAECFRIWGLFGSSNRALANILWRLSVTSGLRASQRTRRSLQCAARTCWRAMGPRSRVRSDDLASVQTKASQLRMLLRRYLHLHTGRTHSHTASLRTRHVSRSVLLCPRELSVPMTCRRAQIIDSPRQPFCQLLWQLSLCFC